MGRESVAQFIKVGVAHGDGYNVINTRDLRLEVGDLAADKQRLVFEEAERLQSKIRDRIEGFIEDIRTADIEDPDGI